METANPFSKDYEYVPLRDEEADWWNYNDRRLEGGSSFDINECGNYKDDLEESLKLLEAHPDVVKGWVFRGLIHLQVRPGKSLERDFKAGFKVKPFRHIDSPAFVDYLKRRGLIVIEAKAPHPSVELKKNPYLKINGKEIHIQQLIDARNEQLKASLSIERESEDNELQEHSLVDLLNYSIKQNMMIRTPKDYQPPKRDDRFERGIPSPDEDTSLPLYEYAGNTVKELKSNSYQRGVTCDYWGEPYDSHAVFPGEAEAMVKELEAVCSTEGVR